MSTRVASSGASTLSLSSGSVFDGRRLNHQGPPLTVSPSSSSSSSSTVPRMSYALKIFAYSATKIASCRPSRARPGRGAPAAIEGHQAYRARLAEPPGIPRRRAQDPQMAPPPHLDALPDGLASRARRRRLHDRVGQRFQIVLLLLGGAVREAHHLPAPRHGPPLRCGGAKVVAVRLAVGGW